MDTFERACSKAGRVRIPKQVLGSDDRAIAKAFLRGLFSADGSSVFRTVGVLALRFRLRVRG